MTQTGNNKHKLEIEGNNCPSPSPTKPIAIILECPFKKQAIPGENY